MAVHNKLSLVSQYKLALACHYSTSPRKGPRTILLVMDSQQVMGCGSPQSHQALRTLKPGLSSLLCFTNISLQFLPTTNIIRKNKLGDVKIDIKELGDVQAKIFIKLRQDRLLKHYMQSRNHGKKKTKTIDLI